MSLYNRLFGENEDAEVLLGVISVTRSMFGRYRDIYLNKEGTVVTVVSRIGGWNKSDFKQEYNRIENHPNYIKTYTDDIDPTYAYFEFTVPDEYKYTCKKIAPESDRLSVGRMFEEEIKEANDSNSEAHKKMMKIGEAIFGDDATSFESGGIKFREL